MRKLQLSEQLKNGTKISIGTIVGQVITIFTLPIITRLYSGEVIGIWAVINSISNIVQNICDLGITNALMMCEEDGVQRLYSIITTISAVLCIFSGSAIFGYYLISGKTVDYALLIGVLVIIYAFTLRSGSICSTLLNRNKKYDVLMKNSAIRFASAAIVSIFLGAWGISIGYYIGNIFGQVTQLLHMKKHVPKREKFVEFGEYKKVIVTHKSYVKYQMPASLMTSLRTELPNILISAFFGNTILGYFSISQKLLTVPSTFLGQALGKIFYQTTAEMRRKGKALGEFVNRNIRRGMIVAFVPMVMLAAFGDAVVTIYFGIDYSVGGVLCRIIVYQSVFSFVSAAIQGLDVVLEKQQYVLYTCLAQTVLSSVAVWGGYIFFGDIYVVAVLMVVSFVVVQIWYYCKMYQAMNLNVSKYLISAILLIVLMFIVSATLRSIVLAAIRFLDIEALNQLLVYFVS